MKGQKTMYTVSHTTVAVVGLGYVGLPLAVAFAKAGFARVVGFDISATRVAELNAGRDVTHEVDPADLAQANLAYTIDERALRNADFVVVAVPTPIYEDTKEPDLRPVDGASDIVGRNLKRGATVVFESTVWPGLTEERCVPIIEHRAQKLCGHEWFVGYSPERINPGDKVHTLATIPKVVSGMDHETLAKISWLYRTVCAVVHEVEGRDGNGIKEAEFAKIMENTQRDLNIALMNEFSRYAKVEGLDFPQALAAAYTKWNFGRYKPGMVGGHCISVDPFYLTTRALAKGYNPKLILAGRAMNDGMPAHVADLFEEGHSEACMQKQWADGRGAGSVLVLGVTFKENVPDTRNSPARHLIDELARRGYRVFVHDPRVSAARGSSEFNGEFLPALPASGDFIGIIVTVAHDEFSSLTPEQLSALTGELKVLVDVRGAFAGRIPDGFVYKTL